MGSITKAYNHQLYKKGNHVMPRNVDLIRSEAIKYITVAVIGACAYLLTKIVVESLTVIDFPILQSIWAKIDLYAISLLLLAFVVSFGFMVHYRRKSFVLPPSGGYEFFPDPGYYINKKNSGHYCNPCLSKGYASRLSIHHEDGLKCRSCGEIYIDAKSEQAAFAEYAKSFGSV